MDKNSGCHLILVCVALGALLPAQAAVGIASPSGPSPQLRLRYACFDPVGEPCPVPPQLRSAPDQGLSIVQFAATPTAHGRAAIGGLGGRIVGYLPDHAYVVRLRADARPSLRAIAGVRWVGAYHPAYRLEPELVAALASPAPVRCHLVLADKREDRQRLIGKIEAIGGHVDDAHEGSLLLEASLTGPQLVRAAGFDEVLWIDRVTPIELDMDNARIQGGANFVETQGGYTGAGVKAHVYEGIEANHPDFTGGASNVASAGAATAHGHAAAGILFGNGQSNPAVRGMAPDCGKFYTEFQTATASRWQVFDDLVNVHDVSHTSSSWGNASTFYYTSVSAEADDMVFDHDLAWTQGMGNGSQGLARPQAWAKNVFSIGGVFHGDDSNPLNDSCANSGSSTGPASDGRFKPTLVGYTDSVGTSDLTGVAGFSPLDWFADFGGTSAAAPMVGGHNVLAIQMFTDEVTAGLGLLGNPLRVPGGGVHQNRPHFPTLKALMVASAAQYPFTATSTDNRREQQGWGFPDLRQIYERRARTFVVDEIDVLTHGQVRAWPIDVAAGEPSLRACLNWSEPAANPAAASQLVNNLSLRVTPPAGAPFYWGNHQLADGVWSQPGGSEDSVNSIECVFVQNPAPGTWTVEVIASAIVLDNHVETTAFDADYGLVVIGGVGPVATVTTLGSGCGGVVLTAAQRPLLGSAVGLATSGAPAGTLLGLMVLSLNAIDPPLALAAIGMPGCELHQQLDVVTTFAVVAGVGASTLSIPNTPSLVGTRLLAQSATLTPGANPLDLLSSNGLALILGTL